MREYDRRGRVEDAHVWGGCRGRRRRSGGSNRRVDLADLTGEGERWSTGGHGVGNDVGTFLVGDWVDDDRGVGAGGEGGGMSGWVVDEGPRRVVGVERHRREDFVET